MYNVPEAKCSNVISLLIITLFVEHKGKSLLQMDEDRNINEGCHDAGDDTDCSNGTSFTANEAHCHVFL